MEKADWDDWWPRWVWVGECFFWYWLTQVVLDKFHRAVKRLCVCCCRLHHSVNECTYRKTERMHVLRCHLLDAPNNERSCYRSINIIPEVWSSAHFAKSVYFIMSKPDLRLMSHLWSWSLNSLVQLYHVTKSWDMACRTTSQQSHTLHQNKYCETTKSQMWHWSECVAHAYMEFQHAHTHMTCGYTVFVVTAWSNNSTLLKDQKMLQEAAIFFLYLYMGCPVVYLEFQKGDPPTPSVIQPSQFADVCQLNVTSE